MFPQQGGLWASTEHRVVETPEEQQLPLSEAGKHPLGSRSAVLSTFQMENPAPQSHHFSGGFATGPISVMAAAPASSLGATSTAAAPQSPQSGPGLTKHPDNQQNGWFRKAQSSQKRRVEKNSPNKWQFVSNRSLESMSEDAK